MVTRALVLGVLLFAVCSCAHFHSFFPWSANFSGSRSTVGLFMKTHLIFTLRIQLYVLMFLSEFAAVQGRWTSTRKPSTSACGQIEKDTQTKSRYLLINICETKMTISVRNVATLISSCRQSEFEVLTFVFLTLRFTHAGCSLWKRQRIHT